MEGTILRFDISNNTGVIRGNDGTRYQFTNSEWKDEKEFARVGLLVNFEVNLNNEPVDIYCIPKDKGKRIWQYDGYLVMLQGNRMLIEFSNSEELGLKFDGQLRL